jgi:hypothetical protein
LDSAARLFRDFTHLRITIIGFIDVANFVCIGVDQLVCRKPLVDTPFF